MGICAAPNGHVYVTDETRVECFDSQGAFLYQWGPDVSGPWQLSGAKDISADAEGNLVVADIGNGAMKFTATGAYLGTYGPFPFEPRCVAVNPLGDLYLAGESKPFFDHLSSTGAVLASIGSGGTGDGQFAPFGMLLGIALDRSGNVYVTDVYNYRVQKFSATGVFLAKWGSYGYHQGQFVAPWGIAVDGAGNVYVTDVSADRVQVFTSNGTYITEWGGPGNGPGQFNAPTGIAVDQAGNVYVTERFNHRVQKFGPVPTPSRATSWGRLKNLYR
jgi:DNA-binding beta-propeller fold protein YncE